MSIDVLLFKAACRSAGISPASAASDLKGLDLQIEADLISQKQSQLPAATRKAVTLYVAWAEDCNREHHGQKLDLL